MVWGNFLGKNLLDFFREGGPNPCSDGLGPFFRDEMSQGARLSEGGAIAIWAMSKNLCDISNGASLALPKKILQKTGKGSSFCRSRALGFGDSSGIYTVKRTPKKRESI